MNSPPSSARSRLAQWLAVACCLISGSVQEILPLSDAVYWFNLIVLSGVTVFTLMRCVFTPVHVTLWDFFAGMIGMMYGLGTFNTALTGISSIRDLGMLTNAPLIYVHTTLGHISILAAILMLIGLTSKTRVLGGLTPESINKNGMLLFGVLIAATCIVLVAIGSIGYHGDLLAEDSITPNAAATYAIFCSAPAAASLVFMWGRYSGLARMVAATALLALFAVALYLGRRNVVFAIIVCTMAHFAATRSTAIINRQSVATILAAGCLMPIVTTGFMAMRMASYETPAGQKASVGKVVTTAIDIITHDKGEVDRMSAENLKDRTFLVGYLAELAWRIDVLRPLYGRLFLFDLGMSVPRALWAEKFKYVRVGAEEGLSHPRLGMPSWDAANSVLTTGMTDFGPFGMIAYPLGLMALYVTVLGLIRRLNAHIFLIMSFAFLMCLANIENQLLVYFTFLRDVVMLSTALFVLLKVQGHFAGYNRTGTHLVAPRLSTMAHGES
jgi:hypothetical protein